jgi:hypothetical protein
MAREQPRQSYLPRARMKLFVRFDEGASHDVPAPPKKPPHLRGGKTKDEPDALIVERDGNAFVLKPKGEGASSAGAPQDRSRSSDKRTFVLDNILPVRATLTRNGIRTADTLSATLRWLDLPLDPRSIRALGVELYLGCIDPALAGAAQSICPTEFVDTRGRSRSNLRFQGFADVDTIDFPEGDMGVIEIEATDNTRILIDQDAPPQLTIAADNPIDQAIAGYLAKFPQFVGLRIEYRPAGAQIPSLGTALAKSAYRPKLGAGSAGGGATGGPAPAGAGGGGGAPKLTVWDYLTDACGVLGLIVRVEGTTVIVQRPRTLWAGKFGGRPDDPFTGRILPSGREVPRRLFIYGENVSSFSMSRKFVRWTSCNVEVRCYSALKGRTLVARYPGTSSRDRQSKPTPGNANDEKWIVQTVHGIDDEATLRVIAQGVYEQLGRSELNIRLQTINLGSFGGSNSDPDVLDLQAGDAIDFELQRTPEAQGTAGATQDAMQSRAASFLTGLGFDSDLAAAYGQSITQVGLTGTYRTRSVGIEWDSERGIAIDLEAVNFLEVRADKSLPAGEEIEPPAETGAAPERVVVGN